ncbi:hypothetical protein [Streptomyces sp. NBC_00343]|uniref:hypothetical protein n=1 Tax=Streptomyces sp. NBC_00343 TaxID=2975719 RepID=UPI002E2C838E|nr:hypothetical protein [Streptomyces sp. NBC_00343]
MVHGARNTVVKAIDHVAGTLDADEIMLVPIDLTGTERGRTPRTLTGRRAPTSPPAPVG